eukprot:Seg3515.2 transcript_id=Seg3515.2/GoldUCD/mRNA.D3Y31 product="Sperm flagellar protein 1" protein_id=Seg3515.2/GoldUCD/D3Y31
MTSGSGGSENFDTELDETALQELYTWIDEIPLSRPKKNISRDFSDGVLVAEIIHHFLPKLIDLHNYIPANGNQAKADNWNLILRKALSKLGYQVPADLIKGIIASKSGNIEIFLHKLRHKIETFQAKKKAAALREKDQVYDELGGEVNSGRLDSNGVNYNDGYFSYRQDNGKNGAYPPEYGYSNIPKGQSSMYQPPNQVQQPPYYYQSGPRAIPDNRSNPPSVNDVARQQRQFPETSPRAEALGKNEDHRLPQAQSVQDTNEVQALKMTLEEKEQALLSSQETVQILHVKVRRLEHLLHLKNLRIDDLTSKLTGNQQISPTHQISPQLLQQQNFASQGHHPQNLPPSVPPLKQHPPLPGISSKPGVSRHYGYP